MRRYSDFETLGEALDYAALGTRGLNFHDPRGALARAYPYSELRDDALAMAHRLIATGVMPADRVALIAETGPYFAALFFGCIYAGAWPVPLPLPTSFGGKEAYVDQLTVQIKSADPDMLFYPAELETMAGDAARACGVPGLDWEGFAERAAPTGPLPIATPDQIAYLQYSSGSTRFPHGVAVTHRALLNNLAAHSHEPQQALTSGADGLHALRHLIAHAPAHLNPGGALWLEHGYDQAAAVRELLAAAGFADVESKKDLAGIERISGGWWRIVAPSASA